ncbi:prolipoprotein diacylglyceryl transferase [methanotrophic endosymbiont of Bathymodiolus puteoserpentis (Logatchev)]|jgi:phosphatidylglycerol:prolipoprotein diacylglycerol transferase|uniref:prolipoprotein diacylglyceryl transferase n=1 Tax=methanotrophic endosymbiont of Bathymodiolus puteoserpentis (Logatchev) TaxID=343235 RepID=UPI00157AE715|nr:prolipoprotein diacylglyceryl transferase [methanotrophic endosymbiont of Bathymodiolus puteoserpentis (Logatchev)]
MLTFPVIDPVAISLGPIKIHWYGLMYLIGIAGAWYLLSKRVNNPHSPIKGEALEDLIFYAAMGVILGGRFGYVLFYNFNHFLADPVMLFKVWQGGMSFHGGLIGVMTAMWIFAKKHQCTLLALTDFIAPVVPIGLFAGRIGNFINAELWGKPTDVYWAFVFPGGGPLARHPSQLYEAALEGVALFLILWVYSSKPRPAMAVSGLFALFYGLFRFIVEFYRVPDAHLGYLALDWLTMGQILSIPLIVIGVVLLGLAYRQKSAS